MIMFPLLKCLRYKSEFCWPYLFVCAEAKNGFLYRFLIENQLSLESNQIRGSLMVRSMKHLPSKRGA